MASWEPHPRQASESSPAEIGNTPSWRTAPEKRLISYPYGGSHSTYTIPHGINIIGESAFSNCGALTRITIPDSVVIVEDDAFDGLSNLTYEIVRDSYGPEYYQDRGLNSQYFLSLG